MTERELEKRLSARYRADANELAPAELRTEVAAIPDLLAPPGRGIGGFFEARRPLLVLSAALLLTALAVGGALAVGSGLLRLPWQRSTPVDPAAIEPCELVSGGPSRELAVTDEGVPAIGASNIVDYEEWRNASPLDSLPRVGGAACYFLLEPDGHGSRTQDSILQLRSDVTTGAEAQEIVATLFADRPPISSADSQIKGHRAWVGILNQEVPLSALPLAVAVSAEPYFFVVRFDMDESILGLSDAAMAIWWDEYWEPSFWPGIRAPVEEILMRLSEMETATAE